MAEIALVYRTERGPLLDRLLNRGDARPLQRIAGGSRQNRTAFDALLRRLRAEGHVVTELRRDQQTQAQDNASGGRLPCVLLQLPQMRGSIGADWRILVTPVQIEACKGDVDAFIELLSGALDDLERP